MFRPRASRPSHSPRKVNPALPAVETTRTSDPLTSKTPIHPGELDSIVDRDGRVVDRDHRDEEGACDLLAAAHAGVAEVVDEEGERGRAGEVGLGRDGRAGQRRVDRRDRAAQREHGIQHTVTLEQGEADRSGEGENAGGANSAELHLGGARVGVGDDGGQRSAQRERAFLEA